MKGGVAMRKQSKEIKALREILQDIAGVVRFTNRETEEEILMLVDKAQKILRKLRIDK
jgi:hypothetical protein